MFEFDPSLQLDSSMFQSQVASPLPSAAASQSVAGATPEAQQQPPPQGMGFTEAPMSTFMDWVGKIGDVLSSTGAGLQGKPNPVTARKNQESEIQQRNLQMQIQQQTAKRQADQDAQDQQMRVALGIVGSKLDPKNPTQGMLDMAKVLFAGGKSEAGIGVFSGVVGMMEDTKAKEGFGKSLGELQKNPNNTGADIVKSLLDNGLSPKQISSFAPLIKELKPQDAQTVDAMMAEAMKAASGLPSTMTPEQGIRVLGTKKAMDKEPTPTEGDKQRETMAKSQGFPSWGELEQKNPQLANKLQTEISSRSGVIRMDALADSRIKSGKVLKEYDVLEKPIPIGKWSSFVDQNGRTPHQDPRFESAKSVTPDSLKEKGYLGFPNVATAGAYRNTLTVLTQLKRIDTAVEILYKGVEKGQNIGNALKLKVQRGLGDADAKELRRLVLETIPSLAQMEGMAAGRVGEVILREFELPQLVEDTDTYASAKKALGVLRQRAGNNKMIFEGKGIAPSLVAEAEAAAKEGQTEQGGGLAVGDIQKGYRFKGGDPSKQQNWEKVQ